MFICTNSFSFLYNKFLVERDFHTVVSASSVSVVAFLLNNLIENNLETVFDLTKRIACEDVLTQNVIREAHARKTLVIAIGKSRRNRTLQPRHC